MEKILNREKTLKTSQKNVKKVNSKIKKNGNKKNHSKIPKKEPKINVQINLTDLKKQEILEKSNKNKATMQKDEKKDKIYYDYPEDLKYDVFGKQYKFSYKDK
jgi:beta-xylosidase